MEQRLNLDGIGSRYSVIAGYWSSTVYHVDYERAPVLRVLLPLFSSLADFRLALLEQVLSLPCHFLDNLIFCLLFLSCLFYFFIEFLDFFLW